MKVTIIVPGRLHGFYLAEALQNTVYLKELVTSLPKFMVKKKSVIDTKKTKITSLYINEIINRTTFKLLGDYRYNFVASETFDYLASYTVNMQSDVYIIWSSYALHTIRRIRKYNPQAIIILERGSAHIAEQAALLEKTTKKSVIDSRVICKEIQEYQAVDYISTISSYALQSFIERGFSTNKMFINNMGVDLKDFHWIDRASQVGKNEFVVGYVGAMSSQKNIKGLIFAVKKLIEQGLAIKLLLVGEIDSTTFDKQLLDQHFIVYQQAVPQAQLIEFYKQMNLFVLNSVQDGFGMVILQAMATGLPVIGTTNTGCPDVVQDGYNGFVIPIENDEILAEKIRFCYENREKCLEMGQNARKRVEKGFSWEDYGKRYVEFLKKITTKKISFSA